ncbi:hypothetical protein ISCGN_016791 [Ixodes scapularis]
MTMCATSKLTIEREQLYDVSRGSGLLFEARTGTLNKKVWRSRFYTRSPPTGVVCGAADEMTEHLEYWSARLSARAPVQAGCRMRWVCGRRWLRATTSDR